MNNFLDYVYFYENILHHDSVKLWKYYGYNYRGTIFVQIRDDITMFHWIYDIMIWMA